MGFLDFVRNHFFHALPLLISGFFAIVIALERTRTLFFVYSMKDSKGFFDRIRDLVMMGSTAEAVSLCDQHSQRPLARVVKNALLRAHLPDKLIHHSIEMSISDESQAIQKRTSFLATIANVATLLGLFGTIAGLIHSFEAVGHADAQQKSALLAAGISEAMNATMTGLGIAIPCMVAFSFLMNKSNRLTGELEHAGVKILDILNQRYFMDEMNPNSQGSSKTRPLRSVS